MQNIQTPPDVIFSIPANLPIPSDDGACEHLENMLLPDVSLRSTDDKKINLSRLSGWNVIFCYPMTGRPGVAIPEDWFKFPVPLDVRPKHVRIVTITLNLNVMV